MWTRTQACPAPAVTCAGEARPQVWAALPGLGGSAPVLCPPPRPSLRILTPAPSVPPPGPELTAEPGPPYRWPSYPVPGVRSERPGPRPRPPPQVPEKCRALPRAWTAVGLAGFALGGDQSGSWGCAPSRAAPAEGGQGKEKEGEAELGPFGSQEQFGEWPGDGPGKGQAPGASRSRWPFPTLLQAPRLPRKAGGGGGGAGGPLPQALPGSPPPTHYPWLGLGGYVWGGPSLSVPTSRETPREAATAAPRLVGWAGSVLLWEGAHGGSGRGPGACRPRPTWGRVAQDCRCAWPCPRLALWGPGPALLDHGPFDCP
ncbi:MAPK-interacting and spindle-stabilizing protein-like [Dasypus novemcinctus]|uniref:MAPK-interacting and spindle-stabilizing protein-like n=1 Tax=Dasypus novemcinctus TaxID=9361 RepID=UPI00265ECAB9|nr:splicing factor, proline- and glutamine-rich-like [Dasypus novemcinctus]